MAKIEVSRSGFGRRRPDNNVDASYDHHWKLENNNSLSN